MGRRHLSLQEYQSKQLLADHGVAVQKFRVASTVQEVDNLTKDLCKCSASWSNAQNFSRYVHRDTIFVRYMLTMCLNGYHMGISRIIS